MQGENPLHASLKPELVQKSLDHLLSQGQEILTSGAKVSLGESGMWVNRDSGEIQEEIPLFLGGPGYVLHQRTALQPLEAKEMFSGSSCCFPSSCCGQQNPPFNLGICYSLAKTKSLSPFPFKAFKDP